MAAVYRKKLFFDVNLSSATNQAFPCTLFRSTYAGDRYGGVLNTLQALTAGSLAQAKRQNAVYAWYQRFGAGGAVTTSTANPQVPLLDFINATTVGSSATPLANPESGGIAGTSPIYTRDFAVRLRRIGAGTQRGVLYVERHHSAEI
jgi:hypothetical protein